MELMGNSTDGRFLGLIFPLADEPWFISLDYEESGYIRDDDAKEWDTEELLQSLRDGTEEGNRLRAEHGIPPLEVVGWVEPPAYDTASHQLVWSMSARDKGTNPPPEDTAFLAKAWKLVAVALVAVAGVGKKLLSRKPT